MSMVVDIFNTDKKYDIIYVDPPWEYRESGSDKGARGLAKQHYKTMSLDDICGLPIEKIKTDVAVCFMWATFPKIAYALKVLEAWGFIYKTASFVWVKQNKKSNSLFLGYGCIYKSKCGGMSYRYQQENKSKISCEKSRGTPSCNVSGRKTFKEARHRKR